MFYIAVIQNGHIRPSYVLSKRIVRAPYVISIINVLKETALTVA